MKDIDLKFYFAVLRRWLPLVFVIWALISGVALGVALLLPPVYRATAIILVESQQIAQDLARSTVDINSLEQIQVLQQQLLTRTNLLEIADQFEIFSTEPNLSPTEVVDRMTASTEFNQSQFSSTRNSPGAIIFDVSFLANNAALSARVTNQLATLILEQNVRIRTDRASETMQFFQNSVNELGAELARLEAEILEFKNANADSLPDSLEFRRNQITILQERLLQLERDEVSLRESKINLETALETRDGETTLADQTTPNQETLSRLRNELVALGAVYSQTNPNIIALKARIDAFEKLVREETATAANTSGSIVPSTLAGRLEQTNAQLEMTQTQRTAINDEITALTDSIRLTPANEVKLNSLQRSYEYIRIQYTDSQRKLSEAATGEQLELRQKGERFELIEQPSVPDSPISPNRKLIAIGGSVAGLMLALAIVFLIEILNKRVRRPFDLVSQLEIQPFATVPYVQTAGEITKGRLTTSAWILALAGGIPAALYLVHYYYYPLDFLLQNFAERVGLLDLLAMISR